jgi:hypothetical protein
VKKYSMPSLNILWIFLLLLKEHPVPTFSRKIIGAARKEGSWFAVGVN